MRDLLLTLFIFGAIPFIIKRPYIGILMWSWLGYMNPHRYAWGFAYNMPFAQITALALFLGMFLTKEKLKLPITKITVIWMLFVMGTLISTVFATNMDGALRELDRFIKIQIVVACTMMLMVNKERIVQLIWVIVISIGFFSVKGGAFSLATGLKYRIGGPPDSFIGGNNEIALATLMIMPFMYFLRIHAKNKYIRWGLLAAMLLSGVGVIGSYSRGAFLAGMVTLFFLWLGMKKKMLPAVVVISLIMVIIPIIPEQWYQRMNTIETYEEDDSAMGRINAWYMAVNLANARPLVGGGFNAFTFENFEKYAPDPLDHHDAHSIYFEVLGELGYVGLFMFLSLWMLSYLELRYVRKRAAKIEELVWASDLAKMTQVCLLAYLSGGAFLGLAFFDLPYHLMSIAVLLGLITRKHLKEQEQKNVRVRL